jgi:hypothetical protein
LAAGNYRHPKPVEDLDLYLRMARTCKFHNLRETVLHYRIHPSSICQSDLDGQARQAIELLAAHSEQAYGIKAENFKCLRANTMKFSAGVLVKSARHRSGGDLIRFWEILASPTFTFTGRCLTRQDDFRSKVVYKILDGLTSVLSKNHGNHA